MIKKNSPAYVVGFMVLLCAISGIAVSFVQLAAKPTLDANARLVRNRTIARVFGITVAEKTAAAYDAALAQQLQGSTIKGGAVSREIFTRKTPPHDVGFIFGGMGFWDYLTGIVVLSEDLSTIRAIDFIDQKETPGLGARIEEQQFKDQFAGFPLQWDNPVEERITFGKTIATRRIDAITGATQTSIALAKILNSELDAFKSSYTAARKSTPPVKE